MTQSILINASVSVFSLVMENSQFNILSASLKHLHQPRQTLLQPREIGSLHVDEMSFLLSREASIHLSVFVSNPTSLHLESQVKQQTSIPKCD